MIPKTVGELTKMNADQVDQAALELGHKPIHPSIPLSARRRMLWGMVLRTNTQKKKKEGFDLWPTAAPTGIPRSEMDLHAVFAACRSGVTLGQLADILDAHYRGVGEYPDVPDRMKRLLVQINKRYGWGVRQREGGIIEVYA